MNERNNEIQKEQNTYIERKTNITKEGDTSRHNKTYLDTYRKKHLKTHTHTTKDQQQQTGPTP